MKEENKKKLIDTAIAIGTGVLAFGAILGGIVVSGLVMNKYFPMQPLEIKLTNDAPRKM